MPSVFLAPPLRQAQPNKVLREPDRRPSAEGYTSSISLNATFSYVVATRLVAADGRKLDIKMTVHKPTHVKGASPAAIYAPEPGLDAAAGLESLTSKAFASLIDKGLTVIYATGRAGSEPLAPAHYFKETAAFLKSKAREMQIDPDHLMIWSQSNAEYQLGLLNLIDDYFESLNDIQDPERISA